MAVPNFMWGNSDSLFRRVKKGEFVLRQKLFGQIKPIKFSYVNETVEDSENYVEVHEINLGETSTEELKSLLNDLKKQADKGNIDLYSNIELIEKELEFRQKVDEINNNPLYNNLITNTVFSDSVEYSIHDMTNAELDEFKRKYEKDLEQAALGYKNITEFVKEVIKVYIDSINLELKYRNELKSLRDNYPVEKIKYTESKTRFISRVVKKLKQKTGITIVFPWQRLMKIDFNDFTLNTPELVFDAEVIKGFTETFKLDFDYTIALDDYEKFVEKINSDEATLSGKSNTVTYLSDTLGKRLDNLVRNLLLSGYVRKIFEGTSSSAKMNILFNEKFDELNSLCQEYGFKLVDLVCTKSERPKMTDEEVSKINALLQVAKANDQNINIKDALLYSSGKNNILFNNGLGSSKNNPLNGLVSTISPEQEQRVEEAMVETHKEEKKDKLSEIENYIRKQYFELKDIVKDVNEIPKIIAANTALTYNINSEIVLSKVNNILGLSQNTTDTKVTNNNIIPEVSNENINTVTERDLVENTNIDVNDNSNQNVEFDESIISDKDINDAIKTLNELGITNESISNEYIAQIICTSNSSLSKEIVLAELNKRDSKRNIINDAIEQVKNEGGVFMFNADSFAYGLMQVLSHAGMTISKEEAKSYYEEAVKENDESKKSM